jgi:Ca2+-binding EF-hand superfamily protein
MLTVDPARRISVRSALKHQWFALSISKTVVSEVPRKVILKLRQKKASSMLSREAMKVIVKHLPEESITELKVTTIQTYFNSLDPQSTGFITAEGLREALHRSGHRLAREDIEDIIRRNDTLGEGRIKYTDFLLATLNRRAMLEEENLWVAFRYFDIDNRGTLTLASIQSTLAGAGCEVSEKDMQSIREEFKIGKDDSVDFERFRLIMVIMNSITSPRSSDSASPLNRIASNDVGSRHKISTDMKTSVISIRRSSIVSESAAQGALSSPNLVSIDQDGRLHDGLVRMKATPPGIPDEP